MKRFLPGHEIRSTKEMDWERLQFGCLLQQAEMQFDVMLTTDKNIRYQQNMANRQIAIVSLNGFRNTLSAVTPLVPQVMALLPTVEAGRIYEISLTATGETQV